MIVTSIDLRGGKAVQLEQGRRQVLEVDDAVELAQRFGRFGEIAVIDLDAAFGEGENTELILRLCRLARCRVGGGIRDLERAQRYLRGGAASLIVGTAATPEFLEALPRERVLVALDARAGRVAVEGWRTQTDETPLDRALRLQPYCAGFLYTDIEREGLLGGIDLASAEALRARIEGSLTIAGGITAIDEIVALDRLGIDAQVGMALYTGRIDPVEAVLALLDFTKGDGLIPTVVCDSGDRGVRMLAYSSRESLGSALRDGVGVYFSRRRRALWRKGETSGATQRLVRVDLDCDRDALTFYVDQSGPTCHTGAERCFGTPAFSWSTLAQRIEQRARTGDERSYTRKLLRDPALLRAKLLEEAEEVAQAATRDEVAWECADLLYFLSVRMQQAGVRIDDVMAQLASRAR
ncbi:MAG TPA: phosphoribosyl-ATP diphosphatase [Candidatus Baltobacteraceae bacterium]|nr:phosphoribosyl-ATP diphosphatase [Candidatus Baltobacteraceae bacterium]